MSDMDNYYEFLGMLIQKFPKFKIKFKQESAIQKFIGFAVSPFAPGYLHESCSSHKYSIYFPSRQFVEDNYERALRLLMHEYVHMYDYTYEGILYRMRYNMPYPFEYRAQYESRAYAAEIIWDHLQNKFTLQGLMNKWASIWELAFTTSETGWMLPRVDKARQLLYNTVHDVVSGRIYNQLHSEPFINIKYFIKMHQTLDIDSGFRYNIG